MQVDPQIKLPTPLKIQNKLNELRAFNLFIKDTNYITYDPNNAIMNMFYIYLFRKYKNKCFVRDKNNLKNTGLGMSISVFATQRTKIAKETNAETLLHLNVLADELANCIKNKNIEINIIPVSVNGFVTSHANILIYRKKFNHIEHFEPHGKKFGGDTLLQTMHYDKMLSYFVSKVNEKLKTTKETEIKLIKSNEVCPRIHGLQALESFSTLPNIEGEGGGYCLAWSLFFAELCLMNPEIPSSELLTYIFNILDSMEKTEQGNYLKQIIRGYAIRMNEKLEKYFSILYNKNGVVNNSKYFTKLNIDTAHVINAFIGVEINLITDPTYVDKYIQKLENDLRIASDPNVDVKIKSAIDYVRVNQEINFFKVYKQFDEIPSSPLHSPSPQLILPPTQLIPPASLSQPIICINPKNKKCIKTNTKKIIPPKTINPKSCPEGKEINPNTGRCIKTKAPLKTKAPPKTKKIIPPKTTNPQSCPEGKEINPNTGRCIKIKTPKTIKKRKA